MQSTPVVTSLIHQLDALPEDQRKKILGTLPCSALARLWSIVTENTKTTLIHVVHEQIEKLNIHTFDGACEGIHELRPSVMNLKEHMGKVVAHLICLQALKEEATKAHFEVMVRGSDIDSLSRELITVGPQLRLVDRMEKMHGDLHRAKVHYFRVQCSLDFASEILTEATTAMMHARHEAVQSFLHTATRYPSKDVPLSLVKVAHFTRMVASSTIEEA